jgi:hypothetical protein
VVWVLVVNTPAVLRLPVKVPKSPEEAVVSGWSSVVTSSLSKYSHGIFMVIKTFS